MSIIQRLGEQAARQGGATCLEVYDETDGVTLRVSFDELLASVASAALVLRGAGALQEHDMCGLLAHNSVAFLSFSLGAMCLGATAVHLNWQQPAAINEQLLLQLQVPLLVHSEGFKAEARAAQRRHRALRLLPLEAAAATPLASALPFAAPAAHTAEAEAARRMLEAEAHLSPDRYIPLRPLTSPYAARQLLDAEAHLSPDRRAALHPLTSPYVPL